MTNTKIPGLSFSLKRAVGITAAKRAFTKATGIPTFSQLEVLYDESSYRIYE